jgi:uracil-DNA glycosylase
MSEETRELHELVQSARAWIEWLHYSGVDELPSHTDLAREIGTIGSGGSAAPKLTRQPKASRPAHLEPSRQRLPGAPAPARAAPERPLEAFDQAAPAMSDHAADAPVARTHLPADERRRRLAVLAETANTCTRCRLHAGRTQSVFGRGDPGAEIVFVGEGPGYHEDQAGVPFVGAAGQLLDKMIVAMGLAPDEVYICNAVKCRPPENRKPEPDELQACAPFLQEQLELLQPKVLVALGATGVQALLGSKSGIMRIRGVWKLYKGRIPVMPTFHPAYLLRSPEKKREVWDDLKAVLARIGREPPPARARGR